jgi:protein SCO1/2
MTPSPKPLPSAALVHGDGKQAAAALLQGHWTWLYFGYANCPDVCPAALDFASREYRKLERPERVRVVFVSVDPARDRAPKLKQFVEFYHPTFTGVTANAATIDTLTRAVGASYVIDKPATPGGSYTVSHSNMVFALDPEGRLVAVYVPEGKPGALAEDFNRLTAKEKE